MLKQTSLLAVLAVLVACGPPPSQSRWRTTIREALLAGDSKGATEAYANQREKSGADDNEALLEMAKLTLWRGLLAPSAELQIAAINAIERHEVLQLADEVSELIASEDDAVSAAAAIALLRDHPQAASIAAALFSSRDPRARAIIVRGIGRKITKRAASELRAALADPAPAVRTAGIAGLVKLNDPADVAALATLATSDPEGAVRARAARALAHRRRVVTDETLLTDTARALLADKFLGARLAGVGLAGRTAGGRELLRTAARGDDLSVAVRAAATLGKGPAWKPLLLRALAAEDWALRVAALGAVLETTDRDTAIAAANTAVTDPRPEVRLAAARLYYRLGDRARALSLFQIAVAATPPSFGAAIELVNRYEDRRGFAAIATLIASEDRGTRSRAIAAHQMIGRVTPGLVAALADPAPALRMVAADVLLALLKKK